MPTTPTRSAPRWPGSSRPHRGPARSAPLRASAPRSTRRTASPRRSSASTAGCARCRRWGCAATRSLLRLVRAERPRRRLPVDVVALLLHPFAALVDAPLAGRLDAHGLRLAVDELV